MKQITCNFCGDTYPDFDAAHVCSKGPYAPRLKPKMNERIAKLAEQANILIGEDSYGKFAVIPGHEKDPLNRQGKAESYDALEKFAELIVEECAAEADKQTIYCRGIPWGRWIKEHFGVE